MGLQRVPEEDEDVNVPIGDPCADLLVTTERSTAEARDWQA